MMYLSKNKKIIDITKWHVWFAWRPVVVESINSGGVYYVYKLITQSMENLTND